MSTRDVGSEGEQKAVDYLKKLKFKIIERNLATNFGEIDIVAEENKTIVFIEVKLRNNSMFGAPAEAVGARKQGKIIRSALEYVKRERIIGKNMRFDVLAIGPEPGKIELIRDAFQSKGGFTV
jgi:putative endonuclease